MFSLSFANSIIVSPKTSWYFGGDFLAEEEIISPVSLSNKPGACHLVVSPSSAGLYPFPFWVIQCNIFGPGICFKSDKTSDKCSTSWPSMGPKYLKFNDSK